MQTDKKSTEGMTPNEIIHHHLKHPDEPVTGEEIRDAKITEEPVTPEPNTTDTNEEMKEADAGKEDRDFPIRSSYDVLGGY